MARSDARRSLEEALWRAAAFADLDADVVFVDALASVEELQKLVAAVPNTHEMANLEGGGRSPVLHPKELEDMGFKLVAYPLSLLGAAVRAQERALAEISRGRAPCDLPSFEELKELVDARTRYAFSREKRSRFHRNVSFNLRRISDVTQALAGSHKQGIFAAECEALVQVHFRS